MLPTKCRAPCQASCAFQERTTSTTPSSGQTTQPCWHIANLAAPLPPPPSLYTRKFDIGSHPRAFYARVVDCLVARSLPVSDTLPSISVAPTQALPYYLLDLSTLSPPCANRPRFHITTTSSAISSSRHLVPIGLGFTSSSPPSPASRLLATLCQSALVILETAPSLHTFSPLDNVCIRSH